MKTRFLLQVVSILVAVVSLAIPTEAAEDIPMPPEPPDLVLVLSGGGARGAAHIGVLRVLEELHVAPDMIIGTSMGSIVGGLYAAGWSPDEIEQLLLSINWNEVFTDRIPRNEKSFRRKQDDRPFLIPIKLRFGHGGLYIPSGLLGGQSLELLLRGIEARSAPSRDFDELPIPYRAVAADLQKAQPVVIGAGSLATAMRASMAIPGMFSPVALDGRELADGGSVANLPVGVAQQLGAKSIIAIDITSPLPSPGDEQVSFLEVYQQANDILTVGNRRRDVDRLGPGDVYIRPDLEGINFLAFDRAEEAVALGAKAARAEAEQLERFSVSEVEWQAFLARQRRPPSDRITVDGLELDNNGRLSDGIELEALDIQPPLEVDPEALRDDILRLADLQPTGVITYRVEDRDGGQELVLSTPEPPYGRNSLQFGLGFLDDFRGSTGYSVTARHQMLPINRKAGEWQNILQIGTISHVSSLLYQPLSQDLRWYVFGEAAATKADQEVWFEAQPWATYRLQKVSFQAGGGRVFGNWSDLSLAAFVSNNRGDLKIGDPLFPDFSGRFAGLEVVFRVDTEDSVVFPTSGGSAQIRYARNLESFGSDRDFNRVHGQWAQAFSFGEFTLRPYLEYGDQRAEVGDFFDLFFLGGLGRLSGLGSLELYGEKVAFARLVAYRRLKRIDFAGVHVRLYAGMGLEAGNVFFHDESVSIGDFLVGGNVFIGADTPLGPLYLAYGYTEGGRGRWYLSVGDRF